MSSAVIWLGWIAAGLAIEGIALFNSTKGDTLSEHLWAWLGIARPKLGLGDGVLPQKTMWVLRFLFLGFMAWFTVHIMSGGAI